MTTARALGALALGALFTFAPRAQADEPITRPDTPCAGCIAMIPAEARAHPVPLVVVLHGDEGSPSAALGPWRLAAREHGVALLAPRCPKARGCERSWWQWNGDPAFLDEQIDALAKDTAIDPERVYLAGWSGGASYLARSAARLSDRWSAVVLAGGGIPPDDGCPRCPRPTYYLAGDRNPLFDLTDRTRAALVACGVPVRWERLPGRDHGGELAELSRPARTTEILDYLLTHRATCAQQQQQRQQQEQQREQQRQQEQERHQPQPQPPQPQQPQPQPQQQPQPQPPARSCACNLSPPSSPTPLFALALALLAARGRGRKRRLPSGDGHRLSNRQRARPRRRD